MEAVTAVSKTMMVIYNKIISDPNLSFDKTSTSWQIKKAKVNEFKSNLDHLKSMLNHIDNRGYMAKVKGEELEFLFKRTENFIRDIMIEMD